MTDVRRQRAEDRGQITEDRSGKAECGSGNVEVGRLKVKGKRFQVERKSRKQISGQSVRLDTDFGRWPPASPSCRLYEPEAVGATGACALEGNGSKAKS